MCYLYGAFFYRNSFRLFRNLNALTSRMSVFTQNLNPITGRMEWVFQNEDYDYKQEIARSAYADMLHDDERNQKYYDGLRSCVRNLRKKGEEIHVLDIGTGTGLLSMMAVKCGVDSVTACEAFSPVAECASMLIEKNGYKNKIKLIGKRSTELSVGPDEDQLPKRANLLITEVFDTELIGEGAIETFRHAKEHLLTADALIVPCKGTIYAQVVESKWVKRWNKISSVSGNDAGGEKDLISTPSSISRCNGNAAVWDIQLSQISRDLFSELSKSIEVFKFDWSGREIPLTKNSITKNDFTAEKDGTCDAVFMWWDLTMDFEEKIILSCAPYWAHPDSLNSSKHSNQIPWRDHWMQAVYFPSNSIKVNKGDNLRLTSTHDEYSLWFDVDTQRNAAISHPPKCPICSCGIHALVCRNRLGQLSDPTRVKLFTDVLSKYVNDKTVGLILGDTCMWAVAMVKLGARHVYIKESSTITKRIIEPYLICNYVEDRVTILPCDTEDLSSVNFIDPINLVFSEPYFASSMLPWHSVLYMYMLESLKEYLSPSVVFLPSKMKINTLPVHYQDLWKIRAPLKECCGFTMSNFDEMIDNASTETDANVEPQPLWEYPTYALSKTSHTLVEVPFTMDIPPSMETKHSISFSDDTKCSTNGEIKEDSHNGVSSMEKSGLPDSFSLNGMALWCDWEFGSTDDVLSTGPFNLGDSSKQIDWDPYTRQGVYLFPQKEESSNGSLDVISKFDPTDGTFKFGFQLKEE